MEYRFYVVARNGRGTSETASHANDGSPAVCRTPEEAPRRNPRHVCTRLDEPHLLLVVWEVNSTALTDCSTVVMA